MKNILIVLVSTLFLTSCSKYNQLTKESYDILYRDNNMGKVKIKVEKPIELEMINVDTIISSVDKKGVVKFDHITRKVKPISGSQRVKVSEIGPNEFKITFLKYKLSLIMTKTPSGEFVIKRNRKGVAEGTSYVIHDNNPNLLFKSKDRKSTKNISLEK